MKVEIKKMTQKEAMAEGITDWPVWSKEASRFDWEYDTEEHCYILEGKVTVETAEGNYEIEAGDYVIFPQGLQCTWDIKEDIRKHYNFK
jgi:uncharacterized cupin superfamily protein